MKQRRSQLSMTGMVRALDTGGGLKWHNRFQVRLVLYLVLLSVATSLTTGFIYYRQQVRFVEEEQVRRGRTLISNLAGQSELGVYSGDRTFLSGPAQRVLWERDVSFVTIYNRDGKALLHLVKPGLDLDSKLPKGMQQSLLKARSARPLTHQRSDYDDMFAPIVSLKDDAELTLFGDAGDHDAASIGIVRLGLSRRPAQEKLNEVLLWGIYLSLIILAMGLTLALFLARRISRPILELARGAEEVRQGQLGYQLEVRRSDELGLLAFSFNRMSSNLQRNVESLAHLNRNLEREVAQRTVALRRSRDFIALLNVPLQLHKLLDTALDALIHITASIAGAVYVAGPKRQLELAVCQGMLARALQGDDELPAFVREAAAATKPIVISPLPRSLPLTRESPNARVLLCAPIRYRERLEGLLVLVLVPLPDEEQLDFVDHAASQLAIAVANARALSEAERLARELEQRNVALLHQRDELQEVNRLKSEFLANISHELRTPLNAVLGYAELLSDGIYGAVTDEQIQCLGGVRESAGNLLTLIDEILDLSKVEAGKMTVSLARVNLSQLVADVVEFSAPLVRDRPYDLTIEMPAEPIYARTDAAKVRQIVVNLIGNAIKFTSEGTLTIRLEGSETAGVSVSVSDTGVGIPQKDLDVIFDAFRQVDGSPTREHGGTGLGLAISKQFAELIGGSLEVTSAVGEGSTFTLVLPGSRQKRPSAAQAKPELAVTIGERNVSGS